MEVEVTHPFEVADTPVAKITVKPIMFTELVELTSNVSGSGTTFSAALMKARITKQATFFDGKGGKLKASDANINKIPMPVAKAIRDKLDEGQGDVGTVIQDGDGVSQPVLYKLNTPLKMKSGKDDVSISELEFSASTLFEAQEILAEDSDLKKAHLLLLNLARPVGVKALMKLPAALVDQITVGDGVGVMRHVAPKF